jgi:ureidoacrylate peracid hydrolase
MEGIDLFDAHDTALLVVDMQNAFCAPDGGFAKAGRDVTAQHSIVPTVVRLVQASRGAGLPVIWTIQENLAAEDRAALARRIPYRLGRPAAGDPEPWCIRNSWDAELIEPLGAQQRADDHVVRKLRMSAFYSTTLDALLRIQQIRCLIVAGVNTEKCVESTVREAFFRDFDVVVPADGVATTDRSFHEDSLRKIDLYFGAVLPASAIIGELDAIPRRGAQPIRSAGARGGRP